MLNWGAIFLGLFVSSILISQSAMDAFAILLSLLFLFSLTKSLILGEEKNFFFLLGSEKIILAWMLFLLLGAFFSPYGYELSLLKLTEFKWILFVYVLVYFLKEIEPTEKIVKLGSLILGFCSLFAIVVFFLGFDPIKGPEFPVTPVQGGIRTGGFLSHPMTFAHVYGMFAALFLGPWIYFLIWKDKRHWALGFGMFLAVVGVICSFTRGAWAALAISFIAAFFLVRRSFGFIFTFTAGLFLVLISVFWEGFRDRLLLSFQLGNEYDSERWWIWKANLQIIKEYPIFGIGYGQNKTHLQDFFDKINAPSGLLIEHAHNQYLQMAAGTGILGLLLYLTTFFSFFWLSIRVFRSISDRECWKKGLSLGTINVQVFYFVGSLTESNFEHSKIKYLIALTWALIVWLAYDERLLKEKVK